MCFVDEWMYFKRQIWQNKRDLSLLIISIGYYCIWQWIPVASVWRRWYNTFAIYSRGEHMLTMMGPAHILCDGKCVCLRASAHACVCVYKQILAMLGQYAKGQILEYHIFCVTLCHMDYYYSRWRQRQLPILYIRLTCYSKAFLEKSNLQDSFTQAFKTFVSVLLLVSCSYTAIFRTTRMKHWSWTFNHTYLNLRELAKCLQFMCGSLKKKRLPYMTIKRSWIMFKKIMSSKISTSTPFVSHHYCWRLGYMLVRANKIKNRNGDIFLFASWLTELLIQWPTVNRYEF